MLQKVIVYELLNGFSGTPNSVQLEFRYIFNETIEIQNTRVEINQVLEATDKNIQNIIDNIKRFYMLLFIIDPQAQVFL